MAAGEQTDLETLIGYRFARPELLQHALTHASLRHEKRTADITAPATDPIPDNERLEFLGDAIVGLVVAELLYHRYPELDEGELTRLRAALVSRKHLGHVGATLTLGRHLRLGKAEERMGGRTKAVLLANCMEALIAALYLEAGLPAAVQFVDRTVYTPYIDELRNELRTHRSIGDYKTALQELLQSRRQTQPEYNLQAESGPDHRKRFLVEVRVPRQNSSRDEIASIGEGTTKKKAEQEAARRLYARLTADTNPTADANPASDPPAELALSRLPTGSGRKLLRQPASVHPHAASKGSTGQLTAKAAQ